MNDIEKIVDLIRRNYSSHVELSSYKDEFSCISFKRSQFTSFDLENLFNYHKLDKKKLLKEWRCEIYSNQNILVLIFLFNKEK